MLPIDLASKFDLIDDHWHPRVVASLNGQDVKIAKVQGDFVWHAHDDEDELFFVFKGELTMCFRDRTERVRQGDMIVVPRGAERPSEAVASLTQMRWRVVLRWGESTPPVWSMA